MRRPMAHTTPAAEAARALAAGALGRDPGPMTAAGSASHEVFVGSDLVVKVIDAAGHNRLDRETALVPHLPAGLTASLVGSGLSRVGDRTVRYACYTRVPGTAPGIGMPGTDTATARSLAEQAVARLDRLHRWSPPERAAGVLADPPGDGGFTGRAALLDGVERLADADRDGAVAARLIDGLAALARTAPESARSAVPVHADAHWGNWLACGGAVSALLDFEWARFGEPADDWFFLIRFSGGHGGTVLRVVADLTGTDLRSLCAACEVREAAYLVSDLRSALSPPTPDPRLAGERLASLEELVVERRWWNPRR
ncbi:phosphotransferase family protein [Nocardiopsis sp. CA-288880]|uniref:phosphotransferase family protein n=1 Tax=Nocardiopsis sp. CA-288880 TaxID=3239995 RepID=UPI003D990D7B